MQKYIVMGNWTDEGRKTLDTDYPKRLENSKKLVEEYKGSLCFTMGEYDFIGIIDIPDEESMVKLLLKMNTIDKFTTKTLRAWTDTEFMKMATEL
jgi:uncharacterized protein with GYD domain